MDEILRHMADELSALGNVRGEALSVATIPHGYGTERKRRTGRPRGRPWAGERAVIAD